MSVTIAAAPAFLLYHIGGAVLVSIATAVKVGQEIQNAEKLNLSTQTESNKIFNKKLHLEEEEFEKLFNKEFKTEIMDKETLLKTLEEYGATNINISNDENQSKITCECENFQLTFVKTEETLPYTLTISYDEEQGLDELVNDIGSEYTLNAQEISYNKIKERLDQKNLTIAEEEIYDDNTIVLTINLE